MMTKRWTLLCGLIAVFSLVLAIGCGKEPDKQGAPPTWRPAATIYDVALLGDETRADLLRNIASAYQSKVETSGNRLSAEVRHEHSTFRLVCATDDNPEAQAGLAWEADLVFLAVDATQGALPVHREHALLSRQMAVPNLVVAFTKSRAIDDPELLDIEVLERR